MSNPISSTSSSVTSSQSPTLPVPSFVETAGKTTKIIVGVLAGIAAIGSFAIGVTFTPFAPEMGATALALATALFGLAGFLIFNAVSPQIDSRNISALS